MNLVDDVNAVFSIGRRILNLVPDLTDIVHTVIGGCINLHHIDRISRRDCLACRTLPAGIPIYGMLTVHRLGPDLCNGGFSGSSRSAKQICMTDPARPDLVFQRCDDMILSLYVLKGRRSPFSIQCSICHSSIFLSSLSETREWRSLLFHRNHIPLRKKNVPRHISAPPSLIPGQFSGLFRPPPRHSFIYSIGSSPKLIPSSLASSMIEALGSTVFSFPATSSRGVLEISRLFTATM